MNQWSEAAHRVCRPRPPINAGNTGAAQHRSWSGEGGLFTRTARRSTPRHPSQPQPQPHRLTRRLRSRPKKAATAPRRRRASHRRGSPVAFADNAQCDAAPLPGPHRRRRHRPRARRGRHRAGVVKRDRAAGSCTVWSPPAAPSSLLRAVQGQAGTGHRPGFGTVVSGAAFLYRRRCAGVAGAWWARGAAVAAGALPGSRSGSHG